MNRSTLNAGGYVAMLIVAAAILLLLVPYLEATLG